jgi:putative FmdB family regulatory protein
MPLYEYVCQGCGTRFEVLQRVGAGASEAACPKCGGREVAKQHSTFASAIAGAGGSGSLPCGASSASSCGSGGFS